MGRIGTNVGLITGFPIGDTVDKLIAIQARPRDALQSQVDQLTTQQNALTALSAALVKLQLTSIKLSNPNTFDQRTATSSDPSLIQVTTSGFPAVGNYQFTPLALAQSQQLLSSGFASNTTPLSPGTLTLRFGGALDEGANLGLLNGGRGVAPGAIRITDRSGASAVIDLTTARTVDDVLSLVNSSAGISVRLSVEGDHFVLTDRSGQTASNLKVQEVGAGTTAADLGLAGIDEAANEANGNGVVYLGRDTLLSNLNDGTGLRFDTTGPDLQVGFHDGSAPLTIDFTRGGIDGTKAMGTTSAAAGLDGQLVFSAVKAGSAYAGVQIRFQHDPNISKGNETASYDAGSKVLTFKISEGATTASDIVEALARAPAVAALFTVRLADGSNGQGLISSADSAVTGGPPATAVTPGVASSNSRIQFTALKEGANYNGVTISFVDDANVTRGSETVAYDDSNPANKKLVFHIRAGETTADDVIAALNNDPIAGKLFRAQRASGSDGTGLVDVGDQVTTSGGDIVEPQAATTATTVGDLLDTLNTADPARLRAQISADGQSIELIDLTAGSGNFTIADIGGSHTAADLGLTADTASASVAGRKVLAGLKTTLLSGLKGGQGLGPLGILQITDRSGASANIDLSAAQTIDDVVAAINGSGLGVQAQVNAARNGITVSDTTGQTASNFIIDDGDGLQTAEALGLATDAATVTVNSGSLNRQTVNENTLLSSLNGGAGVAQGSFRVFNTASGSGIVDLTSGNIKTVGDLLAAIDALHIGVDARINDTGDGIELVDTLGGSGTLAVQDVNSTTAADLRLTGSATQAVIDGQTRQVIDGTTTYAVTIAGGETLDDLVQKINSLNAGFTAAEFNSGAGATPYRLSITSQRSGRAGNLVFDTSSAGFTLQQTAEGRDAAVLFGAPGAGTISTSNTNNFQNILPGVNLRLVAAGNPVTVAVASSGSGAADAIQALVDAYNQVRSQIADATSFTPAASSTDTAKTGPLFGDSSVLAVETDLGNLFSGQILGAGAIRSLAAVGISVEKDGTLSFDAAKFTAKLASDPQSVKDFFTNTQFGFVARLKKSIDRLSSSDHALLVNRLDAINQTIIDKNNAIADWNQRLDAERNLLLLKFYRMETLIGQMQSQLTAISQIQSIPFFTTSKSSATSK
jgi:flagellar hook-associated protein 2